MDFHQEDQDDMSGLLRVQWTLTPSISPKPVLACAGCGVPRPFECSGKFRLNANAKRLDAWLIYRCSVCDNTWNRPVFERRSVQQTDDTLLQGLMSNDPGLAAEVAFDADGLRRHARDIEHASEFCLIRQVLCEGPGPWSSLEIVMVVPIPVSVRLDRVLTSALGLTRSRIAGLAAGGAFGAAYIARKALRRPASDGVHISLDLTALEDGQTVAAWACAPGDAEERSLQV